MLAVAFNMRLLMASLPPLAERIAEDLDLGGAAIGVLTSIPVLCMGLLAPLASRLARRVGPAHAIGAGITLVLLGTVLRGVGGVARWSLYAGTLTAGIGIALAGTLLPGVVKSVFPPNRAGLGTGLTMFAMMGGAGIASATSVPLARVLGGWPPSLLAWAVAAAVGVLVWVPVTRAMARHTLPSVPTEDVSHALPWRSATALLLSAFLTSQSWQFYSSLAWLAPTYETHGWTPSAAGLLMSLFTGAQLLSGLLAPALADRVPDWRVILVLAGGCGLIGELGVALLPTAAPWLWALLLGVGQGAAFALGLTLLVRYAATSHDVARLTAMAFLVSYGLAALGPTVMGLVRDVGGESVLWLVLAGVMVPQLVISGRLRPGRPKVS